MRCITVSAWLYMAQRLMKHPLHQMLGRRWGSCHDRARCSAGRGIAAGVRHQPAVAVATLNVDMTPGVLSHVFAWAPVHRAPYEVRCRGQRELRPVFNLWDRLLGTALHAGAYSIEQGELGIGNRIVPPGYVEQLLEPFRPEQFTDEPGCRRRCAWGLGRAGGCACRSGRGWRSPRFSSGCATGARHRRTRRRSGRPPVVLPDSISAMARRRRRQGTRRRTGRPTWRVNSRSSCRRIHGPARPGTPPRPCRPSKLSRACRARPIHGVGEGTPWTLQQGLGNGRQGRLDVGQTVLQGLGLEHQGSA